MNPDAKATLKRRTCPWTIKRIRLNSWDTLASEWGRIKMGFEGREIRLLGM